MQPPRLTVNNEDGLIQVSGAVHDDETKNTILNALKAEFGAEWVQGDIRVDPNRGPAPWLVNFPNGVASLNTPGVRVVFDGNSVDVGGGLANVDRDRIAAALKNVLGGRSHLRPLVTKAATDTGAAGKGAIENDTAAADKAA